MEWGGGERKWCWGGIKEEESCSVCVSRLAYLSVFSVCFLTRAVAFEAQLCSNIWFLSQKFEPTALTSV